VVGIALPPETQVDDEEPYERGWLNALNVTRLPTATASNLGAFPGGTNYKPDFTITSGEHYVLNHCEKCGAKLGDHFMHSEPDGPFFGEDPEALRVQIIDHSIELECDYSEGPLGLWLQDHLQDAGAAK
jgi:hypothetical protein